MTDPKFEKKLKKIRLRYKQKTADAVTFSNAKSKMMYDHKHKPLLMKKRNKAYLRLHKKYKFSKKPNKKFSNQRCDPFLMKRRIDRLTYELELSFK